MTALAKPVEERDRPRPRSSFVCTEDGTVIILDPDVGTVSGRTREEAEAEIRRRRAAA